MGTSSGHLPPVRRSVAIAAAVVALAGAAGCGGGVDTEALADSVREKANEDWELRDDFQEVSGCEETSELVYECKVSGDNGEQFIEVGVLEDEKTFRVDEPEINTFFEGEIE